MAYDEFKLNTRIKLYRNQLKTTQEQLAEDLNISLVYLQDIESGEAIPSIELFMRIADVLKVNPSQLLQEGPVLTDKSENSWFYDLPLEESHMITSVVSVVVSELLEKKDTLKINLGRRIHDLRVTRGLSRKELASRVGITAAQIGSIESGTKFTTLKTLFLIMQTLEAPVEFALQDECRSADLFVLNDLLDTAKANLNAKQLEAIDRIVNDLLILYEG